MASNWSCANSDRKQLAKARDELFTGQSSCGAYTSIEARRRKTSRRFLPKNVFGRTGCQDRDKILEGALPGGKDLGADVDLVGPGEAYERWHKTPAYQDWLKQTDALLNAAVKAQ
jgi:hypothetical protein